MPTPKPGVPRPQASSDRPDPEEVQYMTITYDGLCVFAKEMGCTDEEADAEIRRRVKGTLKNNGTLYPGLRPHQWRLHQYLPGGKRYFIISFDRHRIMFIAVRDAPGRTSRPSTQNSTG